MCRLDVDCLRHVVDEEFTVASFGDKSEVAAKSPPSLAIECLRRMLFQQSKEDAVLVSR